MSDTTVTGLPPIGNETFMMLASHGDTLDARAIVRFDTLPQTYSKNSIDSTIVQHRYGAARHADRASTRCTGRRCRSRSRRTTSIRPRRTPSSAILALALSSQPADRLQDVRAGVAHGHAAHSRSPPTRCSIE